MAGNDFLNNEESKKATTMKGTTMNPLTQFKKISILPFLIALSLAAVAPALATPPVGVTTEIIGIGRFGDIDAYVKTDIDPGPETDFWKALINTKRDSDLHVLKNTIAPGGRFGWHSHPGPSLVIVKSGTATFYFGDDPTCTPHVVPTGSGFVDQGH